MDQLLLERNECHSTRRTRCLDPVSQVRRVDELSSAYCPSQISRKSKEKTNEQELYKWCCTYDHYKASLLL